MNRLQPMQGGGNRPLAPYVTPDITQIGIRVEQGFAGSVFEEDPTVGGENPIDPYGPNAVNSY